MYCKGTMQSFSWQTFQQKSGLHLQAGSKALIIRLGGYRALLCALRVCRGHIMQDFSWKALQPACCLRCRCTQGPRNAVLQLEGI